MPGTVEKLKRMKARLHGAADASVAVPFEVQCECGETVRGIRRKSWIEAECQNCCQSVFVLPANVYPSTKTVPSEILGGTFSERLKVVISELFPKPPPAKKSKPKPTKTKTADATQTATDTADEVPQTAPQPRTRRKLVLPRIDVRGAVKRTFTPFRLLMLSMIGVLGLTGYWVAHQRAVETAQQTWLRCADEIGVLLNDQKIVELETVLGTAVAAGRVLGKSDPDWRATLNLFQESAAVNSMAASDLLSAFHRAYDEREQLLEDAAKTVLDSAQTGTFVFDSYLTPDDSQSETFRVELPATPGRHRVQVTVSLPQIAQLLEATGDGRVFFAARLKSVETPVTATDAPWKLTVEPASFVLFTNEKLCEQIGMPVTYDPDLAIVLERQKQFVKGSATWEFRAADILAKDKADAKPDTEGGAP